MKEQLGGIFNEYVMYRNNKFSSNKDFSSEISNNAVRIGSVLIIKLITYQATCRGNFSDTSIDTTRLERLSTIDTGFTLSNSWNMRSFKTRSDGKLFLIILSKEAPFDLCFD